MKSTHCCSILFALGGLLASTAQAQNGPPPGRGEPPQEAFAACQSASRGATCSMATPRGTLQGTCGGPEGKALACMPPKPPEGSAPPPR